MLAGVLTLGNVQFSAGGGDDATAVQVSLIFDLWHVGLDLWSLCWNHLELASAYSADWFWTRSEKLRKKEVRKLGGLALRRWYTECGDLWKAIWSSFYLKISFLSMYYLTNDKSNIQSITNATVISARFLWCGSSTVRGAVRHRRGWSSTVADESGDPCRHGGRPQTPE